jgi:nitric oxide reductase large subunit
VEGQGIYDLRFAGLIPYLVARTWNTELPVFWIATA